MSMVWLSWVCGWPVSTCALAFLHSFLCSGWDLGDSFQTLPELYARPLPCFQGPVPRGQVPVPWLCPLAESWSLWLPLNPPVGKEGSTLLGEPCYPLHLLSVVAASEALAVARWSCCPNPQTFLALPLSGSSRCGDFSNSLRPWEEENGRWHRPREISKRQETSPEDMER